MYNYLSTIHDTLTIRFLTEAENLISSVPLFRKLKYKYVKDTEKYFSSVCGTQSLLKSADKMNNKKKNLIDLHVYAMRMYNDFSKIKMRHFLGGTIINRINQIFMS